MRRISVCFLINLFFFLPVFFVFAQNRGELELVAPNGAVVGTFSQGYALVIGEISYNNGWDQLKSIKDDVVTVTKLLEEQKFIVETLVDKPSDDLKRGIENFLNKYGYEENARLIVFFAGHGATHTLYGKKIGYIVPIDAPLLAINQRGFLQKAIPMNQFETWANHLSCRHILFIFDSCFSGTIFTTRSAVEPPSISYSIAEPVRQFITAGDENETVPAESVFLPLLVRALRDREADLDGDGYVSGTELGLYLKKEVIDRHQGKWHPQFGKSHDTRWDKGDFIFAVGKRNPPPRPGPPISVGSVTVESDIAGELFIDGKPSGTIKAGGTVTIPNVSTGSTEVAVKESDGTVIKAPNVMVRQGQTVTAVIERPIPEGLTFTIIDGKSVTITKYSGNATVVNIPGRIQGLPVTAIGNSAFIWSSLTSVIIPSSITTIGSYAFSRSSLTSVTIPSSVTTIGNSAFSRSSLTSVTIPSSVTAIGNNAFRDCNSLENITVDSRNPSYASIEGILFDKNIKTIIQYPIGKKVGAYTIPSSVTTIGDSAFSNSGLTGVTIPSSVTTIGDSAFSNSGLTGVTIPSSVTTIGNYAFYFCSSLTSVIIPSSVTTIGHTAFYFCDSLTSVSIPSSVTTIGNYAFNDCSSLENITVDSRNPSYASIEGILFDKNIKTIIQYPIGKKMGAYTIPSSVTTIGDFAFSWSSLTSVIIPSSVTTIGDSAFYRSSLTSVIIPSSVTTIGNYAFNDCNRLENITVDGRNPSYASNEGILFDKNIKTIIQYPIGKKVGAYTLPSSVTTIGNSAFYSSSLTSVIIPSSVTTIGNYAFYSSSLTSVTIPSSVTTIGSYAFSSFYSSSLTSATMSRHTQVGSNAFRDTTRIIYRD